MKKWQRIVGIIFVIFIFTSSLVVWSVTSSEKNIGITYEQAINESKPFVVLFYSPWCGYCKTFKPIYKELAFVYKGKYNFVMVDGDNVANMVLAQDFAIGSFPSLFIVDATIDNRIYINPAIYGDIERIKLELNRYLRIRAMIK